MEHISKNLQKIKISKESFNKLPETPGIYIFWNKNIPIYIGKSINLKSRLKSYIILNLGPKTTQMVNSSEFVSIIKVFSELESLLLESSLIHKYRPKYNIISKDDKHPLYIVITKDEFPRIISSRKPKDIRNLYSFGPFPHSTNVKIILKLLRKVFPYSDHKLAKKPCLYSHIGLCNPCPNEIVNLKNIKEKSMLKKKYLKNIKLIKNVLSRKFNSVRKDLENEMIAFSKQENYEEAKFIRDQIKQLDYITQPRLKEDWYLDNPNLKEDTNNEGLEALKKLLNLKIIKKIECFDIAHLSGNFTTASMVTFVNGEPEKSLYKHFRVKQEKGSSDFDSMKEIAKRRSNHFDSWGKPDLIVVDGGLLQIKAFDIKVPVVGIAKNPDRLILPDGKKIILKGTTLLLLQRIRDEAHRFARRYHHLLIKKNLLH